MRKKYQFSTLILLAGILLTSLHATAPLPKKPTKEKNPPEIGSVDWGRDFDAALLQAEKTDKPVFVLFQEVPG